MDPQLLTGRQAAQRLGVLGVDRESARRALVAGVAGQGIRTSAALLYDAGAVAAVLDRGRVAVDDLDIDQTPEECRSGMLILRALPRRPHAGPARTWRGIDLTAPPDEQLDAVRMWFRMSPWTRVLLRHRVQTRGGVPFVATVGGFVLLGAAVTGADVERQGVALRLGPPGAWFETWRGRRFRTGVGATWQWWDRTAVESERRRPAP